ncbi:MAG: mechanosensitive ion channel [Proteobacteria bacterium]|nr:mechanosensitive ion channel [Pseudomonadota bacterium]
MLFLPAVLGALNLEGLLKPVQSMLDKFLAFLPNILAAGVIGVIGWFVARIVRQLVGTLLAATGLDKFSNRIKVTSLSKMIALIVYILILIPVMIAALNALALDSITQPASNMLNLFMGALPAIFAAVLVITIAYVVGKVVSGFITELMTGIGFNSILFQMGIGKEPEKGKRTLSEIAGYLVLITIMLIAVFEASDLIGFKSLSYLMEELVVFGGHILLGLIIIVIGLYLANVASKAIQASGTAQAGLMSVVARVAILILSGSIAIRHMGLANEIIHLAFGLILGAMAVAAAIAFGIGGRDVAARKLEEWTESKKDK